MDDDFNDYDEFDEHDDYEDFDEDFHEHDFDDDMTDDTSPETDGGFRPFPQWQDWMIIGPLSEEIAREKRLKKKIRKDFDRKKR